MDVEILRQAWRELEAAEGEAQQGAQEGEGEDSDAFRRMGRAEKLAGASSFRPERSCCQFCERFGKDRCKKSCGENLAHRRKKKARGHLEESGRNENQNFESVIFKKI